MDQTPHFSNSLYDNSAGNPYSRAVFNNWFPIMYTSADFTTTQRASIEGLRRSLALSTEGAVSTEYGSTDCGQHWAALSVNTLPEGSRGRPGVLVSVLTGHGVQGAAAVMGADGSAVAEGATLDDVVTAAHSAGLMTYRDLVAIGG